MEDLRGVTVRDLRGVFEIPFFVANRMIRVALVAAEPSDRAVGHLREMGEIMEILEYPKPVHWAWLDNKSIWRHLRLALGDGCESCTRNTQPGDT